MKAWQLVGAPSRQAPLQCSDLSGFQDKCCLERHTFFLLAFKYLLQLETTSHARYRHRYHALVRLKEAMAKLCNFTRLKLEEEVYIGRYANSLLHYYIMPRSRVFLTQGRVIHSCR